MHFKNRSHAGRDLARALMQYDGPDTVVYALPRGGVVVAAEVAKALGAPLDLVITRKIGHPRNPEYAVCAITEDGEMLCDESVHDLDAVWLQESAKREQKEARRRRRAYLSGREHIPAGGKRAIIIDDGIATGLSIRAALQSLRKEKPRELIVAVPVAPHEVVRILRGEVDACVVLDDALHYLGSVGAYYDDFPQITDGEVIELLESIQG